MIRILNETVVYTVVLRRFAVSGCETGAVNRDERVGRDFSHKCSGEGGYWQSTLTQKKIYSYFRKIYKKYEMANENLRTRHSLLNCGKVI
jgi:hypothetical protein